MDTSSLMEQILSRNNLSTAYLQVVRNKAAAKRKEQLKKLTCRSWGVSNAYKVRKLN